MPNKKLLILLGVSLLILLSSIIYRSIRDAELASETDVDEVVVDEDIIDVTDDGEIEDDEMEEIKELFNTMEGKFYDLTRDIFLMGDEIVEEMEDDIFSIEEDIGKAKEEIEKEDSDKEIIRDYLSTIQEKISQLGGSLSEVE